MHKLKYSHLITVLLINSVGIIQIDLFLRKKLHKFISVVF